MHTYRVLDRQLQRLSSLFWNISNDTEAHFILRWSVCKDSNTLPQLYSLSGILSLRAIENLWKLSSNVGMLLTPEGAAHTTAELPP